MYNLIGILIIFLICHVNLTNCQETKTRDLPGFPTLGHNLSSGSITILDEKTFQIRNLYYDGRGPAAYFWVGTGSGPSTVGFKVPDEDGSLKILKRYNGQTIQITLPGILTVHDIDWLAMWCKEFRVSFGHIMIPKRLKVPRAQNSVSTTTLNCREFLNKRLKVQWEMNNDHVEIALSAKFQENEYIAFGLSGAKDRPILIGADLTVVFYDKNLKNFTAIDYVVADQVGGTSGPRSGVSDGGRNNVRILSAITENGTTTVKYSRPKLTNDPNDKPIPSEAVNVIAAFGPLNSKQEVQPITQYTTTNESINFQAMGDYTCSVPPWEPAKIENQTKFIVRIGPTGGKRGYSAITGMPSYSSKALYLNDLLIPEITVQRGETYQFEIQSIANKGNTPSGPFYITNSSEGGYDIQSDYEKRQEKIYANAANGKYCEWSPKAADQSLESSTFQDYIKTLRLECVGEETSYLDWTVPKDAPNLLYYQCYTQLNCGWKINVVDSTREATQTNDTKTNDRKTNDMKTNATATDANGAEIHASKTGIFVIVLSLYLIF